MKENTKKEFLRRGKVNLIIMISLSFSILLGAGLYLDQRYKDEVYQSLALRDATTQAAIEQRFTQIKEEAQILGRNKAFSGLFRALGEGGIDKRTSFTVNQWRDEIHDAMKVHLLRSPFLWKISLASRSGKELIVGREQNGEVIFDTFETLRSFENDNYFKESLNLSSENFKLVSPTIVSDQALTKKVIKLIMALPPVEGAMRGLLIIDVDVDAFRSMLKLDQQTLILGDGGIVIHKKPEFEMGNKQKTLVTEIISPEQFKTMEKAKERGVFTSDENVFTYSRVDIRGEAGFHFFLLSKRNKAKTLLPLTSFRAVYISFAIVLLALIFVWNQRFLKNADENFAQKVSKINSGLRSIKEKFEVFVHSSQQEATIDQEYRAQIDHLKGLLADLKDSTKKEIGDYEERRNYFGHQLGELRNIEHSFKSVQNGLEDLYDGFEQHDEKVKELEGLKEQLNRKIGNMTVESKSLKELLFQIKLMSFNLGLEAIKYGEEGKGLHLLSQELAFLVEKAVDKTELFSRVSDEMGEELGHVMSSGALNAQKIYSSGKQMLEEIYPTLEHSLNFIVELIANDSRLQEKQVNSEQDNYRFYELILKVERELRGTLGQLERESKPRLQDVEHPRKLVEQLRIVEDETSDLGKEFGITDYEKISS